MKFGAVWQIWDRLFTGWHRPGDEDNDDAAGGNTAHRQRGGRQSPMTPNGSSLSRLSVMPWSTGVNPCYLVSICVAVVCSLRAPLLASREFATTMDILQNGLAILNGSSTSPSAIADGGGDAFIGACVCVCPRARVPLSVCMNNERTRLRDVLCLSAVSCWT